MVMTPTAASLGLVALMELPGLWLIYKGQHDREWHPVSLPNTQSRRYALVMMGQALIIAIDAWLVATNSPGDIASSIGWCFTRGPVGYLVAALVILALASPILTMAALLAILRHPVEMAHKGPLKDSYCQTLMHRTGDCEYIGITVTLDLNTGEGVQHRTKL